jgi:hypothetical protein
VDTPLTINSTTSNITRNSIIRQQSGNPGYVPILIIQRTSTKVGPGTYDANVYAFTSNTSTNVLCDHIDISLLGNLS